MRRIRAVCCSHSGLVFRNNEDNYLFFRDVVRTELCQSVSDVGTAMGSRACFGVFDGLGGLQESERASRCAAEDFRAWIRKNRLGLQCSGATLRHCCAEINQNVCALAETAGHRMGTTGVLLLLHRKQYAAANVGDSPAYLYRNCHLYSISQEHSDRQLLAKLNIRKRSTLAQFLGIPPETMELEPFCTDGRSFLGDRFLLCSDGLSAVVPEAQIELLCHDCKDTSACAEALMRVALEAGGPDNITVIVCDIVQ